LRQLRSWLQKNRKSRRRRTDTLRLFGKSVIFSTASPPQSPTEIDNPGIAAFDTNITLKDVEEKVVESAGGPEADRQQAKSVTPVVVHNHASAGHQNNEREQQALGHDPEAAGKITHMSRLTVQRSLRTKLFEMMITVAGTESGPLLGTEPAKDRTDAPVQAGGRSLGKTLNGLM